MDSLHMRCPACTSFLVKGPLEPWFEGITYLTLKFLFEQDRAAVFQRMLYFPLAIKVA